MWIAISLSEESGTTMISQLQTSKELIMPCSNMTQVVLTEVNRRQPGQKNKPESTENYVVFFSRK
jgi:hypothetical protein